MLAEKVLMPATPPAAHSPFFLIGLRSSAHIFLHSLLVESQYLKQKETYASMVPGLSFRASLAG